MDPTRLAAHFIYPPTLRRHAEVYRSSTPGGPRHVVGAGLLCALPAIEGEALKQSCPARRHEIVLGAVRC